jgi:Kef-type K+ transport system membrane component KefB
VGKIFAMDGAAALFLGLTMGATSVSISAQTLMEMKMLRSRVGVSLLGAAVFDDVLVILLLSGFLAVVTGGSGSLGLLIILGRMIAFLALSVAFGLWVLPWLARLSGKLNISQSVLSLAIIIMLLYSVAAQWLGGMAAITGSFVAGLMFARSHEKERMEAGIHALAYSLFVPIFFVSIGLSVNLHILDLSSLWLALAVISTAILTKFAGSGFGARLGGLTWRESWQLGAGMISRGEVGLIVASVGIPQGLVSQAKFSAIVGMVLVTTILTPPLLRLLLGKSGQPGTHGVTVELPPVPEKEIE